VTIDSGPLAEPSGTTRWHVRAKSISEVISRLTSIWAEAADEAERAQLDPQDLERALGDPRMGGRLDDARDVRVRMRTSVLTLIVVAPSPETAERAAAVIEALARRHPSRAVIVSPSDPDGPTSVDAHIYAACQLSERSGAEICTEEILLKVGGPLCQHLATAVAPLLIHDLPVVLWWPDDPPFGSRQFRDVAAEADRLLVDSGTFRDDGGRRLAGMAAAMSEGMIVNDIGWMRLTLWRELLAGMFDHPLLTSELGNIRSVRIDVGRPAQTFRITKAACFAGWLASRLDWEIKQPIGPSPDGDSMVGSFRHGRREIRVEFRPTRATLDGSVRAAGSLVRVELEMSRPRCAVRARVTRQADHLLATADWNGAQVTRRAGQLEPFDETPFVAEALDRTGYDRVFEAALVRAVRLIGA
jgi:glucose-6-phosphate dehydrogenase assembly protein OpcA